MKDTPKIAEGTQFLSGWKEVANYLGKGVRTVQRYERELGFPVRRPAGKSHAAVIATRAEVDAWVAASPIRHEFRLSAQGPTGVALDEIKSRLATMSALRDEMRALRKELRTSVDNLRESIEEIHGGIRNRLPGEGEKRTWIFSDDDSLNNEYRRGEYGLALSTGNRRKAS